MAAPKGNSFWNLRLRHGRKPRFENHEDLLDTFTSYCVWIEQNPLIEVDFKGKDATPVEIPKMRIMTKEHFAMAAGFTQWKDVAAYGKKSKDFDKVVTHIENCIYYQKLSGAAAGMLNPSIIARELQLREMSDISTNGESLNPPMSEDERAKRIAALQAKMTTDGE